MSNVVPIRPEARRITPALAADERLLDPEDCDLGAWVSRRSLREMGESLESLLDMVEAVRGLPDSDQERIANIGGLDCESVFDYAFNVFFELLTAEEMLAKLKERAGIA